MTTRLWMMLAAALTLGGAAAAGCGGEASGGTASGTGSGAGGGTTSSGDGGASWGTCFSDTGTFTDYDLKICDPTLDECAIVSHGVDCCGTVRFVGVNKNQLGAFDVCEQDWAAHFPACGCDSTTMLVEQPGDGAVNGIDEVKVECANCTTETCICVTSPI